MTDEELDQLRATAKLPLTRQLIGHIDAIKAENARLREALVAHNDALRTTAQVTGRKGIQTNWDAFDATVRECLTKHHAITNDARAALEVKP